MTRTGNVDTATPCNVYLYNNLEKLPTHISFRDKYRHRSVGHAAGVIDSFMAEDK